MVVTINKNTRYYNGWVINAFYNGKWSYFYTNYVNM